MNIEGTERLKKKKKIVISLILSMSFTFIVLSFFVKELSAIFNLQIQSDRLVTYRYALLGMGIWDLMLLPLMLKIESRPKKKN